MGEPPSHTFAGEPLAPTGEHIPAKEVAGHAIPHGSQSSHEASQKTDPTPLLPSPGKAATTSAHVCFGLRADA